MIPEREAVLREQARTGMVDVASLSDALSLLDWQRARVAKLEHTQQIDDLETIIGQQEEELGQLRDTVGALTEERDDYHAVLSMAVVQLSAVLARWAE